MRLKHRSIPRIMRIIISALLLSVLTVGSLGATALAVAAELIDRVQLISAMSNMWLGAFIFWIIVTVVFGRIYCSSICPVGTLQDIIARLHPRRRYRYAEPKPATGLFMLVVAVACGIGGLLIPLSYIDPAGQYFHMLQCFLTPGVVLVTISVITFAVIAVMAWRWGRLYCNTVCPLGAALGYISRTSLLHIEINPDTCTRCGRCEQRCKAMCIDLTTLTVDTSRCVTCFNCLDACDDGSLRYTINRHQLQTPMFQRIGSARQAAANTTATGSAVNNTNAKQSS